MDGWNDELLGYRFLPTDDELMWGFLCPVAVGWMGMDESRIKFSDQVYKKPPWEICTDSTALTGAKKHYFFTVLEKKDRRRINRTVGCFGTWHMSNKKEMLLKNNNNNNGIVGYRRLYNFKEKGKEMEPADWLMYEFSLLGMEINFVLCAIQKTKKKEMGSASAGGDPCPAPAHDLRDGVPDLPADDGSGFRSQADIHFPDYVRPGEPNYEFINSRASFLR